MNSEFWFISVPGEKKPDKVFQDLNELLKKHNVSSQWRFQVPPDLKVGTLDVLVGLSDELSKLDIYAEGKFAHYMGEVLEEQRSKLQDNLSINGVTVFSKLVEDFRNRAREKKFFVRDFIYDEKKIEESKTELTKLESDKRRQFAPLFRWLKVNFGEAFSALMHVKALRVFVESVLRYGLPVDFVSVIIQPNKRFTTKLRHVLNQSFNSLDSFGSSHNDDDVSSASLAATGVTDYYPYVSFKLETNMCD